MKILLISIVSIILFSQCCDDPKVEIFTAFAESTKNGESWVAKGEFYYSYDSTKLFSLFFDVYLNEYYTTDHLSFKNLPLLKGSYIPVESSWYTRYDTAAVNYVITEGGDALAVSYILDTNSTNNIIKIDSIDVSNKMIYGSFLLQFIIDKSFIPNYPDAPDTTFFSKGKFHAKYK